LLSCGHKETGLRYLWLALASVVVALLLAVVMRFELARGASAVSDPRYGAVTLLHGSLMVFFVLVSAPQFGFGYFFLPLQIGANEMALPLLSGLSFWLALASLLSIASSFLLEPRSGMACWLFGAVCFSVAAILSSVNFCATVTDSRTEGMTLGRLPLTVWGWYVTAVLSLLIFAILLAACALFWSDWLFGTGFFPAIRGAPPAALWQRWFWFFTQAEAYVAMLPCFGLVSHLIATFSRRPVCAERAAVLALCAVGLFGFCVWGFHMFSSALDPFTPLEFALLAGSLGVPASVLLASWLGTLWSAEVRLTTSMLFALGFVSLFLSGGLSGLFLAGHEELAGSAGDDLVTGHFHLVMGVSATFAVLAGLFFWFPKLFGRRLHEGLGKLHFWLTFAGVYCVFMPMHWLGLLDRVRSLGAHPAGFGFGASGARRFITAAAVLTIAAQVVFLANFLWTLLRKEPGASRNPWHATTLEWFLRSPVPREDFGAGPPAIYRSAYMYGVPFHGLDFIPQHISPERLAKFQGDAL
jgi:cytochrome c oxidase subunit I